MPATDKDKAAKAARCGKCKNCLNSQRRCIFLLADWRCSAAEIAERRCAAEDCFAEDNTSLKAQRAREFKSKGILLCVFALVCLIFYVACSTARCVQRSNTDQRPRRRRRRSRRKRIKDLRNTICVFQHANIVEILRHYTHNEYHV